MNTHLDEIWRDVQGFETFYQVSNYGRIYSKIKNKILNPCVNSPKMPHLYIDAKINNKRTKLYIHRLVAQAFIENPDNLPEIDHIDCNPRNNHFSNLRWCTRKINQNNPISVLHNKISQPHSKKVLQFKDGILINEYPSLKEASRAGFTLHSIWSCCQGKNKSHKGFQWAYA